MALVNINGSLKPTAGNIGTLYTATDSTAVVTIGIDNHASTSTTIWVYLVPAGQTAGALYSRYPEGATILGYEHIDLKAMFPVTGDTIQVKDTSGNVTFSYDGQKQG